ncbi:MAG: hypothetical protein V2A63_00205 [Patescibacteria group bacterium]
MKKFLLALLIALTPLVLFGCGDNSDPTTQADNPEVAFQKMQGVVQKLGASVYQQGTHRLEKDGSLVALLEASSATIDLDNFVGKSVEVEGIVSPTTEGNLKIMKVVTITPEGATTTDTTTQYEKYTDSTFGFSTKYPTNLVATQTRRGAAFYDGDQKIIEIVILENTAKQELSDWLIDNYGYTADALRRVSVAGLVGYQFQNATGSVIYLSKDDQVFTLAWYDNSTENRARNREYYLQIVQNFAVDGVVGNGSSVEPTGKNSAAEGEFCGGIAAIGCEAGLDCRLSGSYPDAGGICVKSSQQTTTSVAVTSDQIPANAKLDEISAAELQRGWYYGDREQKKPGTPATWILVDSGTRAAMWRRPDAAPTEPDISLPNATTTKNNLPSSEKKVFDYIATNINFLAPEAPVKGDWRIEQIAFSDPNFAYAVFSAGDQTRRLLFVYTLADAGVSTEMQAYFKPGTEKDWLVIEGADTAFGKAQTIVNATGEITSNIAEGYRLFSDYTNGFSLQYPKDWYWRKTNSTTLEFSNQPFPAGLVLMTIKIVSGANFTFDAQTTESGSTVIYRPVNDKKSLRFSIDDLDYLDVFKMASDSVAPLN